MYLLKQQRRERKGVGRKLRVMSAITTPVFFLPIMSSAKISTDQNIQIVKRTGARMQFDNI